MKAKSPPTISTHNHPELEITRDVRAASGREETQASTSHSHNNLIMPERLRMLRRPIGGPHHGRKTKEPPHKNYLLQGICSDYFHNIFKWPDRLRADLSPMPPRVRCLARSYQVKPVRRAERRDLSPFTGTRERACAPFLILLHVPKFV